MATANAVNTVAWHHFDPPILHCC